MELGYLLSEEKAVEGELSLVKDHSSDAAKVGGSNLMRFKKKKKEETKEEVPYTLNNPSVQFPIIPTRVKEFSWLAIQFTTHGITCMYLPRQIPIC
eukprot:9593634-Ditylum_brightwellii.AAC.1